MTDEQIESLKKRADKAWALAERERAACMRTLQGVRPGARYSKRLRRLAVRTAARNVERFSRMGYAGDCTLVAIQAKRAHDTALALQVRGS